VLLVEGLLLVLLVEELLLVLLLLVLLLPELELLGVGWAVKLLSIWFWLCKV
jgi:hypothetical protein